MTISPEVHILTSRELEELSTRWFTRGVATGKSEAMATDDDSIVSYEHHGHNVAVRSDLKGKHREHCLCYRCSKFVVTVTSALGACPYCGSPGQWREKRPNGNDGCANGHVYASAEAVQNCPIAVELHSFCVKHGMTTPVYECPAFIEKP
jgi:hypothetical protein